MDVEKSFATMKENEVVFLPCTKQKINSRLIKTVLTTVDRSSRRQMLDYPHGSNFKNGC